MSDSVKKFIQDSFSFVAVFIVFSLFFFIVHAQSTTTITVGSSPYSSTLVGTKLYVNNQYESTVSVIDTTTDTVTATIPVGSSPSCSIFVGTKLYVHNQNGMRAFLLLL